MNTILIIFAILLYLANRNKTFEIANKNFIIWMSIALIIVSGLRHEAVGNDTLAYMQHYENNGNESWRTVTNDFIKNYLNPTSNGEKDPGYRVLTKFLYTILPDGRLFLFAVAIMLVGALGYFARKNTKKLETTMFLYIFFITLFFSYLPNSAIRQSITVAAVLIGYNFLKFRKIACFLVMIFLGSLIHKSGLIVLLLFPMFYFVNARKFYKLSFLLFVLALVFSDQMAILFMDQNEIYDGYLSGNYYGASNGAKPIMVIFLFFGLYVLGWLGLPEEANEYENKLIYLGASLALVFLPLIWINPSLIRVVGYFGPFMGIAVGESFSRINNGVLFRRLVIMIFLIHSLSINNQYRFMWQNMELHDRYSYIDKIEVPFGNNLIRIHKTS